MGLLEVEEVTVRFGGITAVDGASLAAEPGQVTGLIGPNGAGKTTLFNVISGLQPPAGGKVRFAGEDITHRGTHARARLGIARTFQRLEAFGSLSVRENVLAAAEIRCRWQPVVERARRLLPNVRRTTNRQLRGVTAELLQLVGVHPFAKAPADSVPTGTARLVELARALAIEPRLLLLDEPSSGLNEEETDTFGELLRDLAEQGRSILMVEHDMDLVMSVCDHIFVLDFGRVIASGPPAAIRSDPKVQEAYLGALPPEESDVTQPLAADGRR